jgi:hypothetical protein
MHSLMAGSTQLVNYCPHGRRNYTCVLLPLYLLSDILPSPLSKLNVQYVYRHCVAVGVGGGCSIVL